VRSLPQTAEARTQAFQYEAGRAVPVAWIDDEHVERGAPRPRTIEMRGERPVIVETTRSDTRWIAHRLTAPRVGVRAILYLPAGVAFGPAHAAALNVALGLGEQA
jgi:hypothetical protein